MKLLDQNNLVMLLLKTADLELRQFRNEMISIVLLLTHSKVASTSFHINFELLSHVTENSEFVK